MKMFKVGVVALASLFYCVLALATPVDETRNVSATGTVSVNNVAGQIFISTWDKPEVHVRGDLGNRLELVITENKQGIQFEVKRTDESDRFDESKLEFKVPAGASLVAEGVSSDIAITGSRGASVRAETVSGNVEIEAETDRAELRSVSGDIEFAGYSPRVEAKTVSGDIVLSGVDGEIQATTVSGDATLTAGEVNIGKFETVSGSLKLGLSVRAGGRVTVESMSGDVEIGLPANQQGEFNAQSFSGRISSKFGEVEQEKYGPGSHLKHVSGASGAVIRTESFSGDIRIGHK